MRPFSGVNTTDLAGAQVIAVLASADEKEKSSSSSTTRNTPGSGRTISPPSRSGSRSMMWQVLPGRGNEARPRFLDANGDNMYARPPY